MGLIQVRTDGDDQERELRSLQDWLRQDPAMRVAAEISLLEAKASAGAMGGWTEAVQLVTENGWSAASFVMALLSWRQTRPRSPRLVIRRGTTEVTMTDCNEEQVQRVIALLETPAEEDS